MFISRKGSITLLNIMICLFTVNGQSGEFVTTKYGELVCTDEEFACEDGSKCIPWRQFCDGYRQCKDGSDERPRRLPLNWNDTGIPCRQYNNICLLPKNQQSKLNVLCRKDPVCTDREFACEDGSGCIRSSLFCDGVKQCRDGSDEKLFRRGLLNDDIMCGGSDWNASKCALPKKYQCDGRSVCNIGGSAVDECLCTDGGSTSFLDQDCFRCLSQQYRVIPISKLCDGVFDCSDLSDECLCKNGISRPELCSLAVFETAEGLNEDISRRFLCDSGNNPTSVDEEQICNGRSDCSNKVDESSCRVSGGLTGGQVRDYRCRNGLGNIDVTRCDGKPECMSDRNEECNCDEIPGFCGYMGDHGMLRCKDGTLVNGRNVCDGLDDCKDKWDELFCTNRTHFYCHDNPTYYTLVHNVCDQKADCADESDEQNCEENFRCFQKGKSGSGTLYVQKDKLCDGILDCTEGADECLSWCINSVFSSTSSSIKNKGFFGYLYTISSVALCGNVFMFIMTIRLMLCPRRGRGLDMLPKHKREKITIYRVLVLSLAISDALVAIYTMAICIKSSLTEGKYCLVDQDWRSGSSCAALGALLLIGSEQSVFIMLIITVFHLYNIWRPDRSVSIRKFSILLALTWIISIFLGVIPLFPHLEDTFTTSIWYADNKLFSTIGQRDVKNFTYWLLLMHAFSNKSHSDIGSWSTLEVLIGELKPNYTPSRRYGFYSSHTVCVPDFFPDPANTASWWYSLLLITINLLGFLVIGIGYSLIYRRATKNNRARYSNMDSELSSKMEKRLTAIIATDFLCWIPVCTVAFLQLSGVAIPQDLRLATGMIILPINSALNPIIYSGMLSVLLKKCKDLRKIIRARCIEPTTRHTGEAPLAGDIELNTRNDDEAEQRTRCVIEETMAPIETHASDTAAEEGQVAIRDATSV